MTARWFNSNKTALDLMVKDFNQLDSLTKGMRDYFTVQGVSFIILLIRLLKIMGFQHRLSLVTDTLFEASGDLFHWIIIFFVVTTGYGFIAFVYLGHAIESVSTFADALLVCAQMLLGEVGILEDIGDNPAGQLWFWTYIFINFFVLVNILLAIIIDSYAVVKQRSERDSTPLLRELTNLLTGKHGGPLNFDSGRKNMEAAIKRQLRWVYLREKLMSGHVTARKLRKLVNAKGEQKRVLRAKIQRRHMVMAMEVPTIDPSAEDPSAESSVLQRNDLGATVLQTVLVEGQVRLHDDSTRLQRQIAMTYGERLAEQATPLLLPAESVGGGDGGHVKDDGRSDVEAGPGCGANKTSMDVGGSDAGPTQSQRDAVRHASIEEARGMMRYFARPKVWVPHQDELTGSS